MPSRSILESDPNEVIDYIIDLTNWVPSTDLISIVTITNTSTVNVFNYAKNATPLTIPGYGDVAAGKAVVFWVNQGTAGTSGKLTFSIETEGSRKIDVSYEVVVKNR